MYTLWEDETSNNREVRGIINDWDMAANLDDKGRPQTTSATHRTGTLPFMSPDLLVVRPSSHYYRHDLESFVYILLHAMVRYNMNTQSKEELPPDLADWDTPELRTARRFKLDLLSLDGQERLANAIRPEWKALYKAVGEPLLEEFADAHQEVERMNRLKSRGANGRNRQTPQETTYDFETCNGTLIYKSFMAILSPPQELRPKS